MKTIDQINQARRRMHCIVTDPKLNELQKTLFAGMLNALVWTADGAAATTMDRLLSGEPVAAGKDPSAAIELLNRIGAICPTCGRSREDGNDILGSSSEFKGEV